MSCLFDSLSYFLRIDSWSIRQVICDYLQQNKPIIDGIATTDILTYEGQDYISHMRRTATWGGAIEIQCACVIWNTRINVWNYRDHSQQAIEFVPLSGNPARTIDIYWTGGHYEPLRN